VFEKGLLAAKKRKFKQAVDFIDLALAIVPESDYYLTSKGVSLHNMNKFQEAIKCYDQALLINPHSAVTFNFKGIVSEN
jgi:tetratricopeptide (TPR) repeat protein